MSLSIKPKPMSVWMSILIFGLAAIVLYLATHHIIPFLMKTVRRQQKWEISGTMN